MLQFLNMAKNICTNIKLKTNDPQTIQRELNFIRKNVCYAISQGGGGGGAVSSVFGRTGAISAQSGDYEASEITNAADTSQSYANPSWLTNLAWSKITGTPTTLAGYGITSPLGVAVGGTGTTTQFTIGSVVFAGASGVYTQDNTNLFFDNTNNRLGIRTATPAVALHSLSTSGDGYSGYDVGLRVQGNNPCIQLVNSAGTSGWQMDYNNANTNFVFRSEAGTEYYTITRSAGDLEINAAGSPNNVRLARSGTSYFNSGQVAFGTNSVVATAQVQIDSTSRGFLPPRMTAAQRTAISSPETGLIVYQTDAPEGVYVKASGGWILIS